MRAISYSRVSTDEQAVEGYSLDSQRSRLADEIAHRGWEHVADMADEGISAKTLDRPDFRRALQMLADGDADVLMSTRLDRITRSVIDGAQLLEWFNRSGASLVVLDMNLDTSNASGRLVANVLITVAEWERDVLAERTSVAMAARRTQGLPISGPSVSDNPELSARIKQMRADGMTFQAIADVLNAEGVPTARGAKQWGTASVQTATGYKRPKAQHQTIDLPTPKRRPTKVGVR